MYLNTLICAACLSAYFSASVFAAEASGTVTDIDTAPIQDSASAFKISGSKIITDDFSFQLPEHWSNFCTLSSDDDICEIYTKENSSEDDSELLFSIDYYEDASLEDLADSSILGFCGNRTYVLIPFYKELDEPLASVLRRFCKKAEKQIKKSFISYITEA